MFKNKSTQSNIQILTKRAVNVIEPKEGELASGLDGKGRMEEPEEIVSFINKYFLEKATLKNLNILISAGPTYEAIDPVRFISNHSTGKMGYALANEAQKRGANVQLVSGPVSLKTPENVQRIDVKSTLEMKNEITKRFDKVDVLIMSAAVADYEPKEAALNKIKKQNEEILNSLSDIGAGFGHDTNKITLITPSEQRDFELKTKDLVAIDILNFVEECV